MKTSKEIEKLATAKYGTSIYSIDEVEAFKDGYNQCQQDKEKDMVEFAEFHYNRLAGAYQSSNDFYVKQSLELFKKTK